MQKNYRSCCSYQRDSKVCLSKRTAYCIIFINIEYKYSASYDNLSYKSLRRLKPESIQ